jgi:hypothetical protein
MDIADDQLNLRNYEVCNLPDMYMDVFSFSIMGQGTCSCYPLVCSFQGTLKIHKKFLTGEEICLELITSTGCGNYLFKLRVCYFEDMYLLISSVANYANFFLTLFRSID